MANKLKHIIISGDDLKDFDKKVSDFCKVVNNEKSMGVNPEDRELKIHGMFQFTFIRIHLLIFFS